MESEPLTRQDASSGMASTRVDGHVDLEATHTDQVLRDTARRLRVDVLAPGGMTADAERRFLLCVRDFGLALSRETSRLEEAERADVLDRPEITATMVVKANEEVRNPRQELPPPMSPWLIGAQIVAFTAAMVTGIFGSYLNSPWQWGLTIGFGLLGVAAQAFAIAAMRRLR